MNVPLLLEAIAGALAVYELIDKRARSPLGWAVLLLVLALLWGVRL